MCYNQNDDMKTVTGEPLKKVKHFIYLGRNIFSNENDVMTRIAKA